MDKKGCITFAYVGAVIFCINLFAFFSWMFMIHNFKDAYSVLIDGEKYTRTVISYTTEERYDSEEGRYYTTRKPTVAFTTTSGKTVHQELDFSTTRLEVGDKYPINYNETSGDVVTLGFIMIIKWVAVFIFCFLFSFLLAGIIRYALGWSMDGYYKLVSNIGFKFFSSFFFDRI